MKWFILGCVLFSVVGCTEPSDKVYRTALQLCSCRGDLAYVETGIIGTTAFCTDGTYFMHIENITVNPNQVCARIQ